MKEFLSEMSSLNHFAKVLVFVISSCILLNEPRGMYLQVLKAYWLVDLETDNRDRSLLEPSSRERREIEDGFHSVVPIWWPVSQRKLNDQSLKINSKIQSPISKKIASVCTVCVFPSFFLTITSFSNLFQEHKGEHFEPEHWLLNTAISQLSRWKTELKKTLWIAKSKPIFSLCSLSTHSSLTYRLWNSYCLLLRLSKPNKRPRNSLLDVVLSSVGPCVS